MKTLRSYKLSPSTGLVMVLLTLLTTLAGLQYYWLGEVSTGERERLQALVRTGAARFSEDFDLELARAYLTLQMDAETLSTQSWNRYAQRYDHWVARAPYPQLVGDVFLVELFDDGRMDLSRFNRSHRQFEMSGWPTEMAALRERFVQSFKTTRVETGLLVGNTPDPVDEDIPALVIPLAHMGLLSDLGSSIDADLFFGDTIFARPRRCIRCMYANPTPLFAYTVITLDRTYLREQFIPALAKKYFANGDRLDYNMAIVSRGDSSKIVYQSDAHIADLQAGDATSNLFSVRLDEFNRLLLDGTLGLDTLSGGGDSRSWRLAVGAVGRGPLTTSGSGTSLTGGDGGRWRLVLAHRTGSLEAAVAGLRFQNILISFGILLLLLVSGAVMIITTRRAQRLAQQKMEFVAAISHELRTPLAVICSAGENLADGVIHDPRRAREYGAVINSEGRRLAEMVEQALEFAGAQSGRKIYALRPVQIGEVLERAIAGCRLQIRESGFTIDQELAPGLPPIQADPAELTRAVQNLIRNAIKYGGERRWIGLLAQVRSGDHGPEVCVTVRDRGLGIAPADLPHIFEPFYRSQDVVVAQIHGSGLGLSMVRQVVESHGGRISVESTIGQGSVFTIYLPCQPLREAQRMPTLRARMWFK
jgi:signal transduction histidine kinase